jgi:hypothetical protein
MKTINRFLLEDEYLKKFLNKKIKKTLDKFISAFAGPKANFLLIFFSLFIKTPKKQSFHI